jgi:hypothetical protein
VSVRSKVAAVAAPEVAAAAHHGKGKRPPAADPRKSAPGSKAARDREAIEAIKANRKPEPASDEGAKPDTADDAAPSSSSSGSSSSGLGLSVPSTGGGMVLGFIAWAIFRNYLNGTTGQWVNAKLFNKVEAGK